MEGPHRPQAALRAHGYRGDSRCRVHLGHVRVHRDHPADLRRPHREHLQGHRRAGARSGSVQEQPGPRQCPATSAPRVGRGNRSEGARRRGRAGQRADRLRAARRPQGQGHRQSGAGRARAGVRLEPGAEAEPVQAPARRTPAAHRRRDRDRQGQRRQGPLPRRRRGQGAHRPPAEELQDRRHRAVRNRRQPRRRIGRAVHDPGGAEDRRPPRQVRLHRDRRQARALPRRRSPRMFAPP